MHQADSTRRVRLIVSATMQFKALILNYYLLTIHNIDALT